jgi:hypothetical protein
MLTSYVYKNIPCRGADIPWRRDKKRSFGGIIALLSHRYSNLSYHKVHIFMIHDV